MEAARPGHAGGASQERRCVTAVRGSGSVAGRLSWGSALESMKEGNRKHHFSNPGGKDKGSLGESLDCR